MASTSQPAPGACGLLSAPIPYLIVERLDVDSKRAFRGLCRAALAVVDQAATELSLASVPSDVSRTDAVSSLLRRVERGARPLRLDLRWRPHEPKPGQQLQAAATSLLHTIAVACSTTNNALPTTELVLSVGQLSLGVAFAATAALPALKALHLDGSPAHTHPSTLDTEAVASLLQLVESGLQELKLTECRGPPELWTALPSATALASLALSSVELEAAHVSTLASLTQLRSLDLGMSCPGAAGGLVPTLIEPLTELTRLKLSWRLGRKKDAEGPGSLEAFAHLPRLVDLDLSGCEGEMETPTLITQRGADRTSWTWRCGTDPNWRDDDTDPPEPQGPAPPLPLPPGLQELRVGGVMSLAVMASLRPAMAGLPKVWFQSQWNPYENVLLSLIPGAHANPDHELLPEAEDALVAAAAFLAGRLVWTGTDAERRPQSLVVCYGNRFAPAAVGPVGEASWAEALGFGSEDMGSDDDESDGGGASGGSGSAEEGAVVGGGGRGNAGGGGGSSRGGGQGSGRAACAACGGGEPTHARWLLALWMLQPAHLKLSNFALSPADLGIIAGSMPGLQSLTLDAGTFHFATLRCLGRLPRLRKLHLCVERMWRPGQPVPVRFAAAQLMELFVMSDASASAAAAAAATAAADGHAGPSRTGGAAGAGSGAQRGGRANSLYHGLRALTLGLTVELEYYCESPIADDVHLLESSLNAQLKQRRLLGCVESWPVNYI
ncbi:hypothetical protein HYH03_007341 [Edaphochlamys debaryana]|uniref:Uncharacterized protein n=1 Tax=Edaphochlamys debaryana TaxID=47281 RepID=A0A836BZD9_9CHLO|nr:hypothetical protein HYH03_007341 [Edaphochlamys debaryana]|eukprot:KAG2494575.1 hypothetical protein HYH03_007341 [Edaphochlamys debaryana]